MPEALVALGESKIPVGRLMFETDGLRQHSTFVYAPEWLASPRSFALAPGFDLGAGAFHAAGRTDRRSALGGPFADSAPDSWGRMLMARSIREGLNEFEVLTLADDRTRHGALRFLGPDGEPLSAQRDVEVPRRVELEELRRIAGDVERNPFGAAEAVRFLAGAGGSLGGARPKANVLDGEDLWIAKFTSINDGRPVERVEVATLALAREVGIRAADARLELARSPQPVALIRRFDRRGAGRIPFISARTALQVEEADGHYYTDIGDVIRQISADPAADLAELWRRVVFTILVSNTDDHLKNHGFIYVGERRWRLSPAFDINPQPLRTPHMKTAVSPLADFSPSIATALEAAPFFDLEPDAARAAAREMARHVAAAWRPQLRRAGLSGAEAAAFVPAFEHAEMERALAL